MNLTHIRPYQILGIEDNYPEEVRFFMPQAQGSGSLLSLESIMLIKLMRVTNADYVFEFGTYKGLTTRLLLANLPIKNNLDPQEKRVYTLDLPDLENVYFQGTDVDLAEEALNFKRKYLEESNSHLVNQVFQDSMKFDGEQYQKKFQLIFIDGNHEISYVKKDTENAFKMIADGPSVIIWHDYGHPEFDDNSRYLEQLGKEMKMFHIEHTKMVIHPIGFEIKPI